MTSNLINNAIFESVSDGILCFDHNQTCTHINKTGSALLGYSLEECIGKDMHHLFPHMPTEIANHNRANCTTCNTYLNPGGFKTEEGKMVNAKGVSIYVRYSCNPLLENGGASGYLALFSDISQRKEREYEIHQIRNNREALIDSTEDLIWSIDNNYNFISFNKAFFNKIKDATGVAIVEHSTAFVLELGPVMLENWRGYYDRALAGETFRVNEELYNPIINVLEYGIISLSPIVQNGEITGVACLSKDITEDTYNRRQIAEAHNELKNIFNLSIDVLCSIDVTGKIVKISDAASQSWSFEPELLIGHQLLEFVHPEDHEQTLRAIERASNGSENVTLENRIVTINNDEIPNKWLLRWDAEAKVIRCLAEVVTDRKLAEQQIRLSEQRFKSLVQNGGDLIGILDKGLKFTYVSPTSLSVLGVEPEGFIGMQFFDPIHPDDQQVVRLQWGQVTENAPLTLEIFRVLHQNGNWRWIEATVSDATQDPAIGGWIVNGRDVTERVFNKTQILESERKYKNLFECNPSPVIIWEVETLRIVECNIEASAQYGYSRDEFLALSISDLRHKNGGQHFPGVSEDPEKEYNIDSKVIWRHKKKNGVLMFMEITGHLFEFNSRICTLVILNDITGKIEAEEKLVRNEALLDEAQRLAKMGSWNFHFRNDKLTWSKELYHVFGLEKCEFGEEYQTMLELIDCGDREMVQKITKSSQETGAPFSIQYKITTPSGEHKIVEDIGYGETDEHGAVTRLFGTVQDITQRKQSELALQLSEARNRGLIASQTNYVIRTDLEGNYSYCNEKFIDEYGWLYPGGTLIGEKSMSSIMPYDHQAIVDTVEKCFHELNTVFQVEIDKPAKEGGVKTTLWDFICLTDIFGRPTEIQCMGIDISDRKKAELALIESNLRYEYVTRATFDSVWDWNVATGSVYWGEGYNKIFGEIEDEGLTDIEKVYKRLHPEDINDLLATTAKALKGTDDNWSYEHRYRRSDGGYAYVINKALILRNEEGKAIRVIGAMQDITSKKEEEKQLRLLESAIANSQESIMITEANADNESGVSIVYVNEAFTKMTGYSMEEVMGLSPRILQGPKTDGNDLKWMRDAVKNFESSEGTLINYKKSGEEYWVHITINPVVNNDGVATHFIAIQRDITEQRIAENQLKELNAHLKKQAKELLVSNAELEQFAFVASHDLQEPLRMITGFLSQLEKKYAGQLDEKAKQYIFFATDGAKRMRQIILDLLEYSRVGRNEENVEKVELNELVSGLLILYKQKIEETSAVINVGPLPAIVVHRAPMKQLFQNLIGNALKYHNTGSTPHIDITCTDTDDRWLFSIRDNGIGIDPEYFEKIFIIFKRLHSKDQYSGTGMGLAVAKKIIENLGGKIWVTSEEGKWTNFYFTILKNIKPNHETSSYSVN